MHVPALGTPRFWEMVFPRSRAAASWPAERKHLICLYFSGSETLRPQKSHQVAENETHAKKIDNSKSASDKRAYNLPKTPFTSTKYCGHPFSGSATSFTSLLILSGFALGQQHISSDTHAAGTTSTSKVC